MKECSKCHQIKPLDEFHRLTRAEDGRQRRCKECAIAMTRAYYYANHDDRLAKQAAYRATMDREAQAAYNREYYRANPEKYRVTDPERIVQRNAQAWLRGQAPEARNARREANREAYRRNPDKYKESARRRRARKMGAPVAHFTEKDWRRIVDRQRGCCFYCGQQAELTRDHLIPLARGGAHSVGNIVAACLPCNLKKRTRTRSEFLMWLRRMDQAAVA